MALTNEDIQTLKDMLAEQRNGIVAEIDKRFEQVNKRFEQVDKQFEQVHHRFDSVDKTLNELVKFATEDVNELHEEHEHRIKKIEEELHITS